MNIENILKVADAIEQRSIADLGFNMAEIVEESGVGLGDVSGHRCGTVACIAGWAISIEAGAKTGGEAFEAYIDGPFDLHTAAAWLGLEWVDGERLFFARGDFSPLREIKPERAVAVLRNLAATGKVDWTVGQATP